MDVVYEARGKGGPISAYSASSGSGAGFGETPAHADNNSSNPRPTDVVV